MCSDNNLFSTRNFRSWPAPARNYYSRDEARTSRDRDARYSLIKDPLHQRDCFDKSFSDDLLYLKSDWHSQKRTKCRTTALRRYFHYISDVFIAPKGIPKTQCWKLQIDKMVKLLFLSVTSFPKAQCVFQDTPETNQSRGEGSTHEYHRKYKRHIFIGSITRAV